jgi:hypothetical protein
MTAIEFYPFLYSLSCLDMPEPRVPKRRGRALEIAAYAFDQLASNVLPKPESWKPRSQKIQFKLLKLLVPGRGFEPLTNGLQNRCSTTELTRQIKGLIPLASRFATGLPPLRWHFCSYSVRIRPKAASIYLCCPGVRIGEQMTICLLVQIGETGATSRFQSAPGKITAPIRAVPLSTQECLGLGAR